MITKGSEQAAVIGVVNPQSASSAQSSGWVDVSLWHALMAIVHVGAIGSSATVDAKLEQANTAGGGGAKDISGAAITQFTKAGSDDNKQAIINLKPDQLDINNGFRWVRLTITPATAASLIAGTILGLDPKIVPASLNDAATVDEIVG